MIIGYHTILYASEPEKTRAFFRDVLGMRSVDAGHGWLIFALPPSEIAAHPVEGPRRDAGGQPPIEAYLMCDNLEATMKELSAKGAEFTGGISEQPWGRLTTLKVPGAGAIGLYQPRHPMAIGKTP